MWKTGNDNLGSSDLQMYFNVIKSGSNRKIVNDFILVVYSNTFAVSRTVLEKFDVKQSMTLKLEMGKNLHCLSSVLFGFYQISGFVRFGFFPATEK